MTFTIPLGVMTADTEVHLPERSEREECADQFEADITYIDN